MIDTAHGWKAWLLLTGLLASTGPAPAPAPAGAQAGTLPPVRVEGNRFVGPDGETMAFRGFSVADPDRLERQGMWSRELFEEARIRWNANIVRLPVHPSAWRERGKAAYLALLDDGIGWAEDVGLYVILDWHTIGNPVTERMQDDGYITTRAETLRFWETVADRYGDRPAVAFYELWNEPTRANGTLGRATWAEHRAFMEELIHVIRAHAPNAIPLVAGFDWAYDLTEAAADPVDAPGVAYVTHPYPMKRPQPWEEHWERDWGFMAERYPVIATELGFMAADGPGAHVPVIADSTYGERIVDFMEERGISWVAWVFDPKWSPQLIEDWDFTPTPQGRFFRRKMRALNPEPAAGASAVPTAPPPSPGQQATMYTDRGRILTAAGEPVILRGVNEMFAWAEDPGGAHVIGEIAKTGANALRIVTTVETDPAALDAAIGRSIDHGMIPIPECHSATGRWDRLPVCVDYWTRPDVADVLRRHERWVLLNIANEAGDSAVTADQFVDGYRAAIDRLRSAGLRVPLVIDGANWGRDHRVLLDRWPVLNRHDPLHRVIASTHTYWVGAQEARKDHYRQIIETVRGGEIPFIIGEGPTPSGWDCSPSPYEWAMTELHRAGIGWLAWSWGAVSNGDCDDPNRYDMTRDGVFGHWETDAGRSLAVGHPASIRYTSRRPCSIPGAGDDCVGPAPSVQPPAPGSAGTVVLVHGAWGGGWDWRPVDRMLTARGYDVYRATLTGLGERVHLVRPDVDLDTHIADVVNLVLFEDLHDVVLVGHSYGGMVITGVADSIPDRLEALIYLDAILPRSGEAVTDLSGISVEGAVNVPSWVDPAAPYPRDVPHPTGTLTQPLTLDGPPGAGVRAEYVLTVEPGREPDSFQWAADRAAARGWPVRVIETGHNAQRTARDELVELIDRFARRRDP